MVSLGGNGGDQHGQEEENLANEKIGTVNKTHYGESVIFTLIADILCVVCESATDVN